MFMVFLRFTENRDRLRDFLDEHKAWLNQGYDEGVFLLSGSLQENGGGVVLAHNVSLAELQARVNEDPFVLEQIADVEILEVTPSKVDERLKFLLPD